MTYGKEDEELPLWSGKVEDFEIWKMRLQALKHSTEDGKKKTCAPKIYSKMINESNFANYEKYLHEIDLDDFDRMMELTTCVNVSRQALGSTRYKRLV